MGFIRQETRNVMTLYYLLKLDKKIPTDPDKIRAKQNKLVYKNMKRAYKHVPFYRQRFDELGLKPEDFRCAEDLNKFPLLTRKDLREWMQDELDAHPDKAKNWILHSTSGSSGIPVKFLMSRREEACYNANWIRVLMMAGYEPFTGKMLTFLTTHSKVDPKKGDSWVQKLGILRRKIVPEHLYVGEGMKDLIELVNDYKPDMLCFRKNVLVRMALYANNHGMKIHHPKVYNPVSEKVDEITLKLLTDAFGPNILDAYGCNETGSCGIKVPGSDVYYIPRDTHAINLIDDDGNLTDNGHVIITTLYKRDFPIINYDVGDTATFENRGGVNYIKTIIGRTNDMVKHRDGTLTSATELYKIPNSITGVAQFRYVQNTIDDIDILLVYDPKEKKNTKEDIEKHFTDKINDLYGMKDGKPEYQLHYKWMDEVPPDVNGKMRCFICNVKDEETK